MENKSTEPIYPQDFEASEAFYAEQQAIAEQMYRDSLAKRGITEEEHLAELMAWCDRQD